MAPDVREPHGTGIVGELQAALTLLGNLTVRQMCVKGRAASCCWFTCASQLPHLLAGKEAALLEGALGIPVLRHRDKKPAGGSEDMEGHFG